MPEAKPNYAKVPDTPANDRPMSLALRQLRQTLAAPTFWIVIISAVLLATLAGPYFTLERMSLPERLVFWGTTLPVSAVFMTFLSIFAFRLTASYRWHWTLVSLLAGAVGVLPVTGSLYLAEGLRSGFAEGWLTWAPFGDLVQSAAPSVIGTALIVNLLIELQTSDASASVPASDPEEISLPVITALHKKLPAHLGHDIVTVRAQDHYVQVTTSLGSAMVLMRLNDAVDLLAPLNGAQVHRSWWVNLDHVADTEPGSNGPVIVTTTNVRVPVGRRYRAAFRAAMTSRK